VLRAFFILTVCALICSSSVLADNWPGWRGPSGDGLSSEQQVPLRWDGKTGENIAWKVKTHGKGVGSPIVWEDRIFLASCNQETTERLLTCLDRKSGKELWSRAVIKCPLESKHSQNSHASGTPATDGKTVYVAFLEVDGSTIPAPNVGAPRQITPGRMVVAAYDFSGKQKWIVRPGDFISAHGFSSCPVLFEDLVIVNGDHDGESYVVALDQETGKQVWKTPRKHGIRSYATPIIRDIDGRTQMVFSGSKRIVSMNPRDGSFHWIYEGPTEQFVASMIYDEGLFYMTSGFPEHHVMAIKPTGKGAVEENQVAWHVTNAKCYVPSPVIVGDYLFVADDRGTANCYDKATGKRHWQERLGRHFHASLVAANGLVYFVDDDGVTKVVRPGKKLEVVAENHLGEYASASPAISQGQLFIRGEEHLFCIGK